MWGFYFHSGPVTNFSEAKQANQKRFKRFFKAMLEGGVYLAPSPYEAGFVSLGLVTAQYDGELTAPSGP